jgi:hypothetical protein
MPFYACACVSDYLAKIGFVVWAYAPQTRGAQIIYTRFLGPLFGTFTAEIEQAREQASNKKRAQ